MSPDDDGSQSAWVFREEEEAPAGRNPAIAIEDVDLQALAEEVYVLLRQQLRLEQERQGWRRVCRR